MKAAPFAYHRAESVKEAADLLDEFGDDAKILAGGQSLVPMLAMRLTYFENLIDISRVDELIGIDLTDGQIRVGAATPHMYVGMDDEIADSAPLLTRATPYIGHFQIRSRGTLGGAIAHADPAAEYGAVALALGAQMDAVSSKGTREIAADDFFTGLWETALQDGEILTAVRFPVWDGRCGFAIEEFARRHGDFAIAGAAVAVELDDEDRVGRCGIGLLGLGSTPRRAAGAEQAVLGRPVGDISAEELGHLALAGLDDIPADLQGSATYRSKVGATMVARAWARAIEEAAGEETTYA